MNAEQRLLQQLERFGARYFAHEFILEFLLAAALMGRPPQEQAAFIGKLRDIARQRFTMPTQASGEGAAAANRMNAQALFNIENLVDKLSAAFPRPAAAASKGET